MTSKAINTISQLHGGDWAGFAEVYGALPLDFSANVNPLGVPAGVQQAIARAAAEADRYPDPRCIRLGQAIAEHEGLSPDWIICGGGAADLIWRIARAAHPMHLPASALRPQEPPRVLLTAPTFSEYEAAFRASGWEIMYYPLQASSGFRIGEDILDAIGAGMQAVILCEPNNPTGLTTDPALLRRILQRCAATDTLLLVDECFNGFLDEPEKHSLRHLLGAYPNLVILKAFTKLYGMAGVRLGYCLTSEETLPDRIRQAGPPWNVSHLAQAAGLAALRETAYVQEARALIHAERIRLRQRLMQMGADCVYGEANYLFWHGAPGLDVRLREHGILLRNCDNFRGLSAGWYRSCVSTRDANDRLLGALREEW